MPNPGSSVQMRGRLHIRHTLACIDVNQTSKNQRKLIIWRYLIQDESTSLRLNANLSFVPCPFVIIQGQKALSEDRKRQSEGETDRTERGRKTPARLAGKLTPNPLLFLHKPHHSITSPFSTNHLSSSWSLLLSSRSHLSLLTWHCNHVHVQNCKHLNQTQEPFNQHDGQDEDSN